MARIALDNGGYRYAQWLLLAGRDQERAQHIREAMVRAWRNGEDPARWRLYGPQHIPELVDPLRRQTFYATYSDMMRAARARGELP